MYMFRWAKILFQAESISSILWRLSGIEARTSLAFQSHKKWVLCSQAQLDAEKQPQLQANAVFFK